MKNIKLTVAYDGTEFHGWQIQPGRRTIQGLLVEVTERLAGGRIVVHGAGRTDSGVHALGQAANFHAQTRLTPAEFQHAYNALLPPAIRVLQAEEVEPRFHSRWDALAKTYQYRISRRPILSPFERLYSLHCPFPLDEEAMTACARLFEGVHDFTSFSAAGGDELEGHQPNPRREILRAEILRRPPPSFTPVAAMENLAAQIEASGREDELIFLVRGKSFLRHMVRKMAGTLIDVGRGRLSPEHVRKLFEAPNRAGSGPTAPPQALCLVSVEYPEPWRIGQP